MNFFLHINRKLIFILGLVILLFFLLVIFSKQINLMYVKTDIENMSVSKADIEEPKFAINNQSKQIQITAKEGNFLDKNKILLKKNVRFKSNDFIIETERVIFNRNEQTAQSKNKTFFSAENTKISSDGFDIFDKGNKIFFYGNAFVILKWTFS